MEQVTVDVEGGLGGGMAQDSLDGLRVLPLGDQEAGSCVAQVMEPDAS